MILFFYGDHVLVVFGVLFAVIIVAAFGASFLADWLEKRTGRGNDTDKTE